MYQHFATRQYKNAHKTQQAYAEMCFYMSSTNKHKTATTQMQKNSRFLRTQRYQIHELRAAQKRHSPLFSLCPPNTVFVEFLSFALFSCNLKSNNALMTSAGMWIIRSYHRIILEAEFFLPSQQGVRV